MPRKKNPLLGWKPKGHMRLEDTGFYPDDLVFEIARKFHIGGKMEYEDDVWKLKERAGEPT